MVEDFMCNLKVYRVAQGLTQEQLASIEPNFTYTLEQTNKQEAKSPIVREYKIGDITYIVKAVVKDGVREDAATKVRRLIHNDLKQEKSPV